MVDFEFSIDLDNITYHTCSQYMKLLTKLGKRRIKKIEYRLSSSKKGYHVEVLMFIPDNWHDAIPDMESFKIGLRYMLLDCYGRIKADISRLILSGTVDRLFEYKDGNFAGEWKVFYEQEKK